MKRNVCLLVLSLLISCTKLGDNRHVEREDLVLTKAQAGFVSYGNDFGLNLLKNQEDLDYRNLILSPLSTQISIGMLLPGARGETAGEMVSALGFGQDAEETIQYLSTLSDQLKSMDKKTDFRISNALVINSSSHVKILPSYQQTLSEFADAEVFSGNFRSESLVSEVNKWSSRNTDGMIPVLIDSKNPLSGSAVAILLNALCFKSTWDKPFNNRLTLDAYFQTTDGVPVRLPMMNMQDYFRYYDDDRLQALQMDYGNGAFVFTIILPREGVLLSDILAELDDATLRSFNASFQEMEVSVRIPKYKIEYSVDLIPMLKAAGIQRAFEPSISSGPDEIVSGADFGNMVSPSGGVFVSEVLQKASFKLDEDGTEAAAITEVEIAATAPADGSSSRHKVFWANHPFLYMISERSSQAILFVGTFTGNK